MRRYEFLEQFVSVIRQKSESQYGCFKKTKHAKFSEKTKISYPLIRTPTCAYQRVRNVCFFGKFGVICFIETPVLRFALLPYYRRIYTFSMAENWHKILNVTAAF